ncbi:MAG: class I SAM-dependent DNA methyltransferase [Candidatus Hodarchaeota archaeon]
MFSTLGYFKNSNFKLDEEIKNLKDFILKEKINKDNHFKSWYNDFQLIYGPKSVNVELYIIFSLIYFIGHIFIFKFVINKNKSINYKNINIEFFENCQRFIKENFKCLNLFNFEYFLPLIKLYENPDFSSYRSLISNLAEYTFNLDINLEYKFDYLIQNIISPIIRHKSGEYYTPPFLVKKMISEAYNFGESVLDPCCGSGNFLIEILKKIISANKNELEKILAINNVYGFDFNPIAIFISKINFLIFLKDLSTCEDLHINLYVVDSLFQNEKKIFDLVIGNPPWYTFRDIESSSLQEKIKKLAEQLEVKPRPKNILNIEISALFFYQSKNLFMKKNGKIFFVIPKGVITGSHASRFRNFKGFKNVKIWTFNKKIEKIFNIDFLCILAQKSEKTQLNLNLEVPDYHFTLKNENNNINYFTDIELKLKEIKTLVPYSIEKKGNKFYTKKLILKKQRNKLFLSGESYYKNLFHKGADLNPRNLIFVTVDNINDFLLKINPDERIFKRSKTPWNKKEFENEIVEEKYLFKIVKSTELVKFYIFDYFKVFLPLSKVDLSFNYNQLLPYAKNFYDKINKIYLKLKKSTTSHKSLMDNLNRWSKLINKRQLSKIKVVYNNSGSILNSAIIHGNYLVTGDLSFYATENIDEAYYLVALLNSNIMTKQIQIKRSSRHIFKIPLESPIKKFSRKNKIHCKLVDLGKMGEFIAKSTVDELRNNNEKYLSKYEIQNILTKRLRPVLKKIDEYLLNLMAKI